MSDPTREHLDQAARPLEQIASPKPYKPFVPHGMGVAGAIAAAVALILGALFGGALKLSDLGVDGIDQTLRYVCVAAWALLIPAWFTLEEMIWAPPADNPAALEAFRTGQRVGHYVITLVGALVFAIVLGISPTPSPAPRDGIVAGDTASTDQQQAAGGSGAAAVLP